MPALQENTKSLEDFIKDTMLEISKPFIGRTITGKNRQTFFEIICNRGCLNKEDKTVRRIFEEIF